MERRGVNGEIQLLEDRFQRARDQADLEVRGTAAQAEKLRAEVEQLRSLNGASLVESDERVRELQLELEVRDASTKAVLDLAHPPLPVRRTCPVGRSGSRRP